MIKAKKEIEQKFRVQLKGLSKDLSFVRPKDNKEDGKNQNAARNI